LAEEYWLNTKQGDVVEGKPVYHATLLRWSISITSMHVF
jgi:hypothetical protein